MERSVCGEFCACVERFMCGEIVCMWRGLCVESCERVERFVCGELCVERGLCVEKFVFIYFYNKIPCQTRWLIRRWGMGGGGVIQRLKDE